jgi:hypothetical protein
MNSRIESFKAGSAAVKEALYTRITGDEDARVCKDIPESACDEQPHNFFAYLLANLFGKVSDEIASARLVIPWLFGALGVPAAFTGFLVPIREGGVLVPQLAIAALVRRLAVRKWVWIAGAMLSAVSLFGMALAATRFEGPAAGWAIIAALIVFSLARGLCSVSAKDVLGKTISKSRRGALMGWSAGLSGLAVLGLGVWLSLDGLAAGDADTFARLLVLGGLLWLVAAIAFAGVREAPGATDGGGNALTVALAQLRLLRDDPPFRQFVTARALLLSAALMPPFFVLIVQQSSTAGLLGLGVLIIANGIAGSVSAPIWGYLGDRSSRSVMALAAGGSAVLGVFTFAAVSLDWRWATSELGFAALFLVLNVMHGGIRLGRKVYLVDMATAENRAGYVAVSNTVIGLLMLFGGLIGLVGDWLGAPAVVLLLSLLSLFAAVYAFRLPEVSDPS